MTLAFVWIPATLVAVLAQTARNTMQHRLASAIGTLGATQVRFLYGLPFALLFLATVRLFGGEPIPSINAPFLIYVSGGALAQILATALMLAAMRQRAFSIAITYTKTEPIQMAVFGLIFLGDTVTPAGTLGILIATAGVIVMSWRRPDDATAATWLPALQGISAGGLFALSAVGFRAAVLSFESGSFLMRASTGVVWSLALQSALLFVWLGLFQREALLGSLRVWRSSLFAGFMGALASQLWFIGFALTAAVNVRTLALLEVVIAQFISRRLFSDQITRREVGGLVAVVGGVALLLTSMR